jgi:hypothetical protein
LKYPIQERNLAELRLRQLRTRRLTGIVVGSVLWIGAIALGIATRLGQLSVPEFVSMSMGFVAVALFMLAKVSHDQLNSPNLGLSPTEEPTLKRSEDNANLVALSAITRGDLIGQCETFEKAVAEGLQPVENPYAFVGNGNRSLADCRKINNDFRNWLQTLDEGNLALVEKELARKLDVCGKVLIGSLVVIGIVAVGFEIAESAFGVKGLQPFLMAAGFAALLVCTITTMVLRKTSNRLMILAVWVPKKIPPRR